MTAPSYMMKPQDQAVLKALPGNDKCIDCGLPAPTWASVTLACFMCLECSGRHRGLGTHISFVRSVQMDSWSDAQIAAMKAGGGNDAVKEFLATKGGIDTSVLGSTTIRQKYDSPAAELWRQVLKARVNGEEEPTELPELTTSDDESDSDNNPKKYNSIQGGGSGNKKGKNKKSKVHMEGFGSSPHPSQAKRDRKDKRKKRNKKILGVGAAAIGAIAAVGWARSKRNGGKLSNRV